MKTLSLNPQASKWRPAAVAVKKLDVPVTRSNGEVITHYNDLNPNERKLYRKAKLRRDAEREMKLFQKILTTEADLATSREELKVATDGQQHKAMQYHIQQISALERKLAKLRGIKPPKHLRPHRKTGRVFRRLENNCIAVEVEGVCTSVRTPEQIAVDKWNDIQHEATLEVWDKAKTIATLQGYQEGSLSWLDKASHNVEELRMIERLQAFESTIEQFAEECAQFERIQHFGGGEE